MESLPMRVEHSFALSYLSHPAAKNTAQDMGESGKEKAPRAYREGDCESCERAMLAEENRR